MAVFTVKGEATLGILAGLRVRFHLGLNAAAHTAGQMLVRQTQAGMESAGGGRLYPGSRRQSSAPGGYPAVQTGQLKGSIQYKVAASKLQFGSRGAFNKGFDYAIAQHEGTSRMAPRPYVTLTVQKSGSEIANVLGKIVWAKMIGGG